MPDSVFFSKVGPFSLKEIASKVGATLSQADDIMISDVATVEKAQLGTITFITNAKYAKYLSQTQASACILEEKHISLAPKHLGLVIHPNPHEAYALIVDLFYPQPKTEPYISARASIAADVVVGENSIIEDFVVLEHGVIIGKNCIIGANTVIKQHVQIGDNTHIANNCSISHSHIGQRCLIHPGARIGQDGFGFAQTKSGLRKVQQIGRVIIGNDIEIGANTCIDRGALEDTIVMDGTKIDNLVQIGHNSIIGRSCVICGQVGLAGTSTIGNAVMLGGQAGVAGHLLVGDGSMIAAQSGVMSDTDPKSVMGGSPAMPIREWHKSTIIMKKLIKQGKKDTDA